MLYVVRHGQTEWNLQGRFQGHADSPLTPLGQRQARAVASRLAGLGIQGLFASPLGRAWATAGWVAEAIALSAVADDRLMECGYGRCEGLTLPEIEETFPGKVAWREEDKWNRRYPEAECYKDVFTRASAFARERLAGALEESGPNLCVVAHDSLNRNLVGGLLGWSPQAIMTGRQPNNAYFLLQGDGFQLIEVLVV